MGRIVASLVAGILLGIAAWSSHEARAEDLTLPSDQRWLQIASRESLDEARLVATDYLDARVVMSGNGWYAVILGPFPYTDLDDIRAAYQGWTTLPDDALPTKGTNYAYTVWPADGEVGSVASTDAAIDDETWNTCKSDDLYYEAPEACSLIIDSASASDDERALAYVYRGKSRAEGYEYPLAIADFGEAIRLAPGLVDAWLGRANVYMEQFEASLALPDYEQAKLLDPLSIEALYGVGSAHDSLGTLQRQSSTTKKACVSTPTRPPPSANVLRINASSSGRPTLRTRRRIWLWRSLMLRSVGTPRTSGRFPAARASRSN